jgi:regulator of replication initiation timing
MGVGSMLRKDLTNQEQAQIQSLKNEIADLFMENRKLQKELTMLKGTVKSVNTEQRDAVPNAASGQ